MSSETCDSLIDRLIKWRNSQPSKNAFTFVDDKGKETDSLSYEEIDSKSLHLASYLIRSSGLKAGDSVLLVYPPSLDFIVAFIACIRVGIIAVPVYPPDPRKMKKDIMMFLSVVKSSGSKFALTNQIYSHAKKLEGIKQKLSLFSENVTWPSLQWIVTNVSIPEKENISPVSSPQDMDICFLQYTSGSTSDPKGVMISHGNLSHNLTKISNALKASTCTVVVSWLPQYHDMGLIGAYLGVLYNGGSGVYMSPFSYIRNPCLWIKLISKYKATHVQAPNFAYQLCARKSSALKTDSSIDLSSVEHMINAAEPIDSSSIDSFYKAFTPFGLKDHVIVPTYGLAEHTVYVCDGGKQRIWVDKEALQVNGEIKISHITESNSNSKEIIGCGYPGRSEDIDVRIVDPETCEEVDTCIVGEIWISSPSKAKGYFGLKDISEETFHAVIQRNSKKDQAEDGYLRTGDLGFFYKDELFICGRIKDLIIIRGRNHFPQDIEASVEQLAEIRPGCTAAFSVPSPKDNESECLCIVAELRNPEMENKTEFVNRVRQIIVQEHGLSMSVFVLLSPRTISKTTSGKIARRRCRKKYMENSIDGEIFRHEEWNENDSNSYSSNNQIEVSVDYPETNLNGNYTSAQVLDMIRNELSQLLDMNAADLPMNVPVQQLGMDSMALTQLRGMISNRLNVEIPDTLMYGESTTLSMIHSTACGFNDQSMVSESGESDTSFLDPASRSTPRSRTCCGCVSF